MVSELVSGLLQAAAMTKTGTMHDPPPKVSQNFTGGLLTSSNTTEQPPSRPARGATGESTTGEMWCPRADRLAPPAHLTDVHALRMSARTGAAR